MSPAKLPASVGSVLSEIFNLVMELAKSHPAAIPALLKLLRAAFSSGDPTKAMRRAAMRAGAEEAGRASADRVLRAKKR